MLRRHVAGFFAVGGEEIVQAMQFAYERLTLVIDPASAVALVPLLRQEPQLVGKRVGVSLLGAMWRGCGPGHVWTGPRLCSDRVVSGLRV
jgi:threonine dehydratase